MLVQQFQRPTRLLAVLLSICLVYVCFSYLQHLDLAKTCDTLRLGEETTYKGEFGATHLLSTKPATMPNGTVAKVAKVGVAVNALDIPVVHRAFKTHQVHNEMHGYPHYIADREVVSDLIDNDRMHRGSGAYTKPAYLLAIIITELLKPESERLQWIFWFDGDTMILNPSTPLETFLPPNTSDILNDVHLVIASNWDGLNSGAFALRVHPWTASMLSGVLAYPMYEKERTMKDRFRDQSAFQFLLTHNESPLARDALKHKNHWAKVPMRWYNSLPVNNAFYADGKWLFSHNMEPSMFDNGTTDVFDDGRGGSIQPWKVMQGDMLVHFAGTKGVRDSWMTPWLDRAEALLPEWNNPNYTAKLQVECAQFWKEYEVDMREQVNAAKALEAQEQQRKKEEEKKKFEEKKKAEERKMIEKEKKKEEQRKKDELKQKELEEKKAAEAAKKQKEEADAAAAEASAAAVAAAAAPTPAAGNPPPESSPGSSTSESSDASSPDSNSSDSPSESSANSDEKSPDSESSTPASDSTSDTSSESS
ncbi:hypothetical protein SEPCBS119000_006178 [Sporothrix epigloea]|uniref:Galactosyl transferase gma12 mnn10 family protein n=1 Tax=Sporothrix epigloea TaxID=1892477 RepID=A0ABP0E5U5_9PEZI